MAIVINNKNLPLSCLECEYKIDVITTHGIRNDCSLGCGSVIGLGTEHYVDCRSPNCPLREVLICQDCKYFKLAEKNYGTCRYFSNYPFSVYTNDYCSWGEKKE